MNETKIKTISEERDEAIWLMNKTSLELNRTKRQLAATEQALQEVQRESAKLRDEYRWLCGYPGFAAMAVCEAAVAHAIASSAESKLTRMTPPDWRDQDARLVMIHACHLLMNAEEAARVALEKAIAEYRDQVRGHDTAPERLKERFRRTADTPAEPSDVDEKEDGLGFFPGFPPGFDVKRAEKGMAQERGDSTA